MNRRIARVGFATVLAIAATVAIPSADDDEDEDGRFDHVLLISIDGMHGIDLDRYVSLHPDSALAQLAAHGRTYRHATATKPSDSFPGMLAMVTGGTPKSTGVFYDDSWDRSTAAATGSCTAGTEVKWKQNLDATPTTSPSMEAFCNFWPGSIATKLAESKLPRDPGDPSNPCAARIWPHQFPRVNNVFELIKAAGGRTAWADKHPAYEFLNGISGNAIDDLYTPEIATKIASPADGLASGTVITDSFTMTKLYDDLKVKAVINQIHGFDHAPTASVGVPTLFGMNFQAVSVGQKLKQANNGPKGGYMDDDGTPYPALTSMLDFVDQSIGAMVDALYHEDLLNSTLIIISAKHGNSPMHWETHLKQVDPNKINSILNLGGAPAAWVSADTGPMIWLADQSKTDAAVDALNNADNRIALNLPDSGGILWGDELTARYGNPIGDSRIPDIILIPKPGTLYAISATKIADHGSFNEEDVHVALLVSNPRLPRKTIDDQVETRQIACTILKSVGISCGGLMSQQIEPSKFLPHSNHKNK